MLTMKSVNPLFNETALSPGEGLGGVFCPTCFENFTKNN